MKLHALLVGINDYPVKPLNSCVRDVEKMHAYLDTLSSHFESIHVTPITDSAAKKQDIVDGIRTILGAAGDDDVALFYFSGHGAQEYTGGRFPHEHDGALECLVCHYTDDEDSGFLLADKEVRYLLSQLPNSPHLVTLFDCCHSGDMVRSLDENEDDGQIKRLSGYFDARPYTEFLFHDDVTEAKLQADGLPASIPFKNHVHLAACSPKQSSWEDAKGGVFTRYLLRLLSATNNQITYQEVSRWAKISLRKITRKQQTPTYSIQGNGPVKASSAWLNLPLEAATRTGYLAYNQNQGWFFTRGALLGVTEGTTLKVIKTDNSTFNTTVLKVEPELSLVKDPLELGIDLQTDQRYKVICETTYQPVQVYINDIDGDTEAAEQAKQILEQHPNTEVTEAYGAANYLLNIFNQQLYFSLPDHQFQPLAIQIDLFNEIQEKDENHTTSEEMDIEMIPREDIQAILFHQLNYIAKWHHFHTLENPNNGFDQTPLKIEVKVIGTDRWMEVTDSTVDLLPQLGRDGYGQLFQQFNLRLTNLTPHTLYVGALNLFSDFEINAEPFDGQSIELEAHRSTEIYTHFNDSTVQISLEHYMEVYNWPWEFWNFTFIVNNYESFTTALPELEQPALENPLTISPLTRTIDKSKGGGPAKQMQPYRKTWGTVKACVRLKNMSYNIVSGQLKDLWMPYQESDILGPYIGQLYIEQEDRGFYLRSKSKPNITGTDENEKNIGGIGMHVGNWIDDRRRRRIFKRARKRMPHKPLVIAEGDSWFLYPFFVKDTIDYVMKQFPVRSIAAAGDELENYKKHGQLLKMIPKVRPKYVLISGGGNDIIGEEIQHLLNNGVPAGRPAHEYLNDKFGESINKLRDLYLYFFEELRKQSSVEHTFVHGYDYIRASDDKKILKKGWVNRYMVEKGITDVNDRARVIRHLVDTFNDMLEEICGNESKATYLNMREKVGLFEWHDEIHPDDYGFEKIGNTFIDAIYEADGLVE